MDTTRCGSIAFLKNKIILHYFCNVVGIEMSGPALSSFIDHRNKQGTKWRRIVKGEAKLTDSSFSLMIQALSTNKLPITKRQKRLILSELEELYHTQLWHSLSETFSKEEIKNVYDALPYRIQKTILKAHSYSNGYSRFERHPGNTKINKIEQLGSYNALAALFTLLRDQQYSLHHFYDCHIHRSAFRLLVSTFQHPSFRAYHEEIWSLVRATIVQHDAFDLTKVGLGFWNLSSAEIEQIICDEAAILQLAKTANMIEDFKDAPLFLYLLYRDPDQKVILKGLESITAEQAIDMMSLDNLFNTFSRMRRRGRSTLQYPTETFPHLCLNS
jgi:hypothetical protein